MHDLNNWKAELTLTNYLLLLYIFPVGGEWSVTISVSLYEKNPSKTETSLYPMENFGVKRKSPIINFISKIFQMMADGQLPFFFFADDFIFKKDYRT